MSGTATVMERTKDKSNEKHDEIAKGNWISRHAMAMYVTMWLFAVQKHRVEWSFDLLHTLNVRGSHSKWIKNSSVK